MTADKICIIPRPTGLGGPAAFSSRLIIALQARGVAITQNLSDDKISAVLVIGGSRHLLGLWRAKRRGARIVQRLNGMNWVHRQTATGLRHFIRAEINNAILATIRSKLADRIIYQSCFTQDWWQRVYGNLVIPNCVIYNGIDLAAFSPHGAQTLPSDHFRLLTVEARFSAGYDIGLDNAVALVNALNQAKDTHPWELVVAGVVPPQGRQRAESTGAWVTWAGVVPKENIPTLLRSAHVFFSADLNAACPNSVIEALACGLPAAAYATGALPEMLQAGAGLCAPYGSNHWKLQPPLVQPLAQAVQQISHQQAEFRAAARRRAEDAFNINHIVEAYLDVLLG